MINNSNLNNSNLNNSGTTPPGSSLHGFSGEGRVPPHNRGNDGVGGGGGEGYYVAGGVGLETAHTHHHHDHHHHATTNSIPEILLNHTSESGSAAVPQMLVGQGGASAGGILGGVYADDAIDSSRATSPPGSVVPFEDDDFTHSLLQQAARNLGVEYTPASHSGIRTLSPSARGVGGGGGGSHGGVLGDSPSSISGGGGGGTTTALDSHSMTDIQHMIDVRTKALGSNHPSVAALHLQMGDKIILQFGQDRAPRAENHYNAALAAHEAHYGYESPEIVPCMTKLGNFYMKTGKYSQAKEMFRRSMLVADKKCGGQEAGEIKGSAASSSADPVKRAGEVQQQNHLHQVLRDLAIKRGSGKGINSKDGGSSGAALDARAAVSGELLSAWSTSIKNASSKLDATKQRKAIECQTEADDDVIPEALPPPNCLSAEQLERVRAPTLRSARELKDLVGYIRDGGRTPAGPASFNGHLKNQSSTTTTTLLDSSPSFLASADGGSTGRQTAAGGGGVGPFSPRSEAATRRAQDLQRTIDQLRAGPELSRNHHSNRHHQSHQSVDGSGSGGFNPQHATEREVARLLMTGVGDE